MVLGGFRSFHVLVTTVKFPRRCKRTQHLPTTCDRVRKRAQHVTSNIVGSCWPAMLRPSVRSYRHLYGVSRELYPFERAAERIFA